MYRSFTDRVFAGICGGLAARVPVNAWWFRAAFIILTPLTLGAVAVLYLILWLIIPQALPTQARRGGASSLLLALVLAILTLGGFVLWMGGGLRAPTGADLYWPGLLVALSAVFFLRQLRG